MGASSPARCRSNHRRDATSCRKRIWSRTRRCPTASTSLPISRSIGSGCAARRPRNAASRWCWQIIPIATVASATASGSTRPPARSRRCVPWPPPAIASRTFPPSDYAAYFATLPRAVQEQVSARWGPPERDPFFRDSGLDCGNFAIPAIRCGNVAIAVQPARGYNIDPAASYHAPDLVPPHGYLAFYAWISDGLRAHAIVHMGKHGNLEWLPGKAVALSAECFPEAALGPLPHLYPFIVNDPGEGAQAKRRAQAVIVDHLTPPLTRAESYGRLAELERL